jgi:hypothetical protein
MEEEMNDSTEQPASLEEEDKNGNYINKLISYRKLIG